MYLLKEKAMWLPGWLDRILQNVDVEGDALLRHREETGVLTGSGAPRIPAQSGSADGSGLPEAPAGSGASGDDLQPAAR
jgi:RND superfamily putative drug exporter